MTKSKNAPRKLRSEYRPVFWTAAVARQALALMETGMSLADACLRLRPDCDVVEETGLLQKALARQQYLSPAEATLTKRCVCGALFKTNNKNRRMCSQHGA